MQIDAGRTFAELVMNDPCQTIPMISGKLFHAAPWCMFMAALLLTVSARADESNDIQVPPRERAYASLLALFDEDRQGYGTDTHLAYVGDQPMTLGLVLSSEAIRHLRNADDESTRRIRKAVEGLLLSQDLDKDGAPGWGIPQPWDAWGDGTENPPHHPYTITTAMVMNGLLDALALADVCTEKQREEMLTLLVDVSRRWCRDVWSEGYGGGYFWYSPRRVDDVFGINASSMFLGALTRLVTEHGAVLDPADRELFLNRTDRLATAIVTTVERRQGAPFWRYAPAPNRYNNRGRNDLVHHVYTLWGIETYRDCGGKVNVPWSRSEAIASVDRFWQEDHPVRFATDSEGEPGAPPRLWSVGMMLAFYGSWGPAEEADRCYRSIYRHYGAWPQLMLLPSACSDSRTPFYARHASHVLYGLALHSFSPR